MPKPTILIVSANDSEGTLEKLSSEAKIIQRLLNGVPGREYEVSVVPEVTTEDLIEEFKIPNRTIEILHYAGHADGKSLHLKDTDASAKAFAEKIKSLNSLKLVFLNGCATKEQVTYFQQAGVPFIVATVAKIGDEKAHWISSQFYQYLTFPKSLKDAWAEVEKDVTFQKKGISLRTRGIDESDLEYNDLKWELHYLNEEDDYSLPINPPQKEHQVNSNHTRFLNKLIFELEKVDNPVLESLKQMATNIKRGKSVIGESRENELLKILPLQLGLRLRQIVARPENQSTDYFREHLYDYAFFFETLLLQSLALISSKVWDDKKIAFEKVPKDVAKVRQFLRQNRVEESPIDYREVLTILYEWVASYTQNENDPFLLNYKQLLDFLNSKKFEDASNFFYSKKKQFWQRIRFDLNVWMIAKAMSEEIIGECFQYFAFLMEYNYASVRGVKVMNFRHLPEEFEPFENIVYRLVDKDTETTPLNLSGEKTMENKAVLSFHKSKPSLTSSTLNLFPFIIDRNCFTETENSEVDLYLFSGFYKDKLGTEAFHFVSVKNPAKIWRLDPSDDDDISLLHMDEEKTLIHQHEQLMANGWEFKNYLKQYRSQFLQLLNAS